MSQLSALAEENSERAHGRNGDAVEVRAEAGRLHQGVSWFRL